MKEQKFKFIIKNKIDGNTVAGFSSATEALKHLKYRNKDSNDFEFMEAY